MDALELRKKLKSRKPNFRRQDVHKKSRLKGTGYRKAKGLQSKVRLSKRGYVKKVKTGYGAPNQSKHLDMSGLKPFIVSSIGDLSRIDPKIEGVILSSTLGLKKKIDIINKALELKLTILNLKDPKSYVEQQQQLRKERTEQKKLDQKKRQEKQKKAQKEADKAKKESKSKEETAKKEGSETIEDVTKDVEQEKQEKAQKDKILTKKED